MELFKNSLLLVTLSDSGELTISEKSGFLCFKKESIDSCNLADIIDMIPDKDGSCLAIAALNAEFYLKMNQQAVKKLLDKWNAIPKEFTKVLIFEKRNVSCFATSNGILEFVEKTNSGLLPCSKRISLLTISMADVVLQDTHKKWFSGDRFFMATEEHAIEIKGLDDDAINHLKNELIKHGAHLSKMKSYKRAFRFSLKREDEYIYTTAKGIAHYYKKIWENPEFCFNPWDTVSVCLKSKGCLRKSLMVVTELPIYTRCEFSANDANEITEYVNRNINENAGIGTLYGKGSNKVYVTGTHILCVGKKEFNAIPKPYEGGKLVKRSYCSSIVNIDGMDVKGGRYDWKAFCCGKGSFYKAVTQEPTRQLNSEAQKHRF